MTLQRSLFSVICKHRGGIACNVRVMSSTASQAASHPPQDFHLPSYPAAQVSSACAKLISALEDYRQKNYGQTLFSRYIKEMVQAMDANSDGKISRCELESLLRNIGADQVTRQDVQAIIEELGEGEPEKQIDVDYVEVLILGGGKLKSGRE